MKANINNTLTQIKKLPFIKKLLFILSKPELNEIIAWSPDGTYITVKQIILFESKILPNYFDSSRMDSFSRQLNLYGFKRITDGRKQKSLPLDRMCAFSNPDFIRGRSDLQDKIKRKKYSSDRKKRTLRSKTNIKLDISNKEVRSYDKQYKVASHDQTSFNDIPQLIRHSYEGKERRMNMYSNSNLQLNEEFFSESSQLYPAKTESQLPAYCQSFQQSIGSNTYFSSSNIQNCTQYNRPINASYHQLNVTSSPTLNSTYQCLLTSELHHKINSNYVGYCPTNSNQAYSQSFVSPSNTHFYPHDLFNQGFLEPNYSASV